MSLSTIFEFLIGRESAIRRIAATDHAVWLGLLFVLSAGLAREYDGEYLVAEPGHVLIPLAASLVTSFLLYLLLSLAARWPKDREFHFWQGYRRFLGLYWMTAPLAWLYAIPVERFMSPEGATVANLWLLGIVSLWRVVLMVMVVNTIWRASWAAFFLVLLFADAVALQVMIILPHPIITLMGGVRYSPSDAVVVNTMGIVFVLGYASLPLWIIGSLIAIVLRKLDWPDWTRVEASATADVPYVTRSAWVAGFALLLAGICLLPIGQPEQRHRYEAEAMLKHGELREAFARMAERGRDEYPPHLDPPPRLGYGQREPDLLDCLEALAAGNSPDWLWAFYEDKVEQSMAYKWEDLLYLDEEKADRWIAVWRAMPRGRELARIHQEIYGLPSGSAGEEHAGRDRFLEWLTAWSVGADARDSGRAD